MTFAGYSRWAGPAPAIQSGPPSPLFVFGDLTAARKRGRPRLYQWGAGRARRATRGVTGEAFTPGQGYFRPLSILEVGRHQLRPICAGLVRGGGCSLLPRRLSGYRPAPLLRKLTQRRRNE